MTADFLQPIAPERGASGECDCEFAALPRSSEDDMIFASGFD